MSDQVMPPATRRAPVGADRSKSLRYGAAVLAAAVGVVYLLIALQVVHVADTAGKDSPFLPMMAAAVAFWIGAVLLVLVDRWLVWLLGAAVQLVVLVGYFAVAPSRDPHYEAWGLAIKVAEVIILGLLLYLVVSARRGSRASA